MDLISTEKKTSQTVTINKDDCAFSVVYSLLKIKSKAYIFENIFTILNDRINHVGKKVPTSVRKTEIVHFPLLHCWIFFKNYIFLLKETNKLGWNFYSFNLTWKIFMFLVKDPIFIVLFRQLYILFWVKYCIHANLFEI